MIFTSETPAKYNEPRPMALEDSMGVLRRRLFFHAKNPWEGETLALKVALIKLTENWKTLVREDLPCPVEFDPADAGKMTALHAEQKKADKNLEMLQKPDWLRSKGWAPVEHYEEAKGTQREAEEACIGICRKRRRNGMRSWRTGPWTTWTKGTTCKVSRVPGYLLFVRLKAAAGHLGAYGP
ncbi:hypothetical protein F5141DRAFT_393291 [Pisolithus sp. B1]|nr:hypothetical protein F5141DRAFT_393291 [Pisolithus sp. B1]